MEHLTCQPGNSRWHTAGFTFIEVIVALALMACTLLAVFGSMRACVRTSAHAQYMTNSVWLAERLIGKTRLTPPSAFEERQGEEGHFRWRLKIAPTSIEGLGLVQVTVRWLEQNRKQNYELVTLVPMVVE